MLPINAILLVLVSITGGTVSCSEAETTQFQKPMEGKPSLAVTYAKINPDRISGYQYVVLESEHYNAFDVKLLREKNDLVIGYISVGEVNPSRYYYDEIKDKTLGKNKLWNSYYLNLRDQTTLNVLMGLIDRMVKKGFNGIFLDTVDAYGQWGPLTADAPAYFNFLDAVRTLYPELHIMQNAGLSLMEGASPFVNSVAIESVVTDYNFATTTYRLRKTKSYNERLALANETYAKYGLPILLIEYAASKNLRSQVVEKITPLGFDYFIGNIELDKLNF